MDIISVIIELMIININYIIIVVSIILLLLLLLSHVVVDLITSVVNCEDGKEGDRDRDLDFFFFFWNNVPYIIIIINIVVNYYEKCC